MKEKKCRKVSMRTPEKTTHVGARQNGRGAAEGPLLVPSQGPVSLGTRLSPDRCQGNSESKTLTPLGGRRRPELGTYSNDPDSTVSWYVVHRIGSLYIREREDPRISDSSSRFEVYFHGPLLGKVRREDRSRESECTGTDTGSKGKDIPMVGIT